MTSTDDCPTAPHTSPAAGLSINWSHSFSPAAIHPATFTFTNLATSAQTMVELDAMVDNHISLDSGMYRVAVQCPGCEPLRELVELVPGQVAALSPMLSARSYAPATLRDVLVALEAPNPEIRLRDLTVPAGSTMTLDTDQEAYARDWQTLTISDVAAAKRVVGVSDEQWGVDARRYGAPPESALADRGQLASHVAREYIYGNSRSVAQWTDLIEGQFFTETWRFGLFTYDTVTINAGGRLVINDKASFFVCRKLRMHVTATLLIMGTGPGLIHPLAYESFYLDLDRSVTDAPRAGRGAGTYA